MSNLDQSCLILNLALALKENGSWAGETHIQKGGYFLNTLLGVPTGVSFMLYKHGPFSFELRELLTDMEALGFIKWNSIPPFGPSISEGPFGNQLRAKFSTLSDQYHRHIDFVARHLGKRNVASLERIATALYVSEEGLVGPSRVARLIDLKPHVDVFLAEKAVEEFDQIRSEAEKEQLIPALSSSIRETTQTG
jgi:hypothetical protein